MMLAMDKMITFGLNERFKKKFRDKSAIRLFEAVYTKIDIRFEKYISAFEKLVKKHNKAKKEEQRKRNEKELRTKRELARLEWTMLS